MLTTKIFNETQAKEKMLESFPRWMDIRKRPEKSVGGKYLSAIAEEQPEINAALKDMIESFFLKGYIGKEDTVMSWAKMAFIGNLSAVSLANSSFTLTTNARAFIDNPKKYALYQSGCIIFDANAAKNLSTIEYIHKGNKYKATLQKKSVWNIFDEYAQMSGLKRYEDETNKELKNRIISSFKNPTNSTEEGLKNAIINSVVNHVDLLPEDISFCKPTAELISEKKDGTTLYDELSAFNQDIARTKKWNESTWEHNFKKTAYILNEWDKEPDYYQDGTGQRNDLLVSISSPDKNTERTDLEVMGYKKSQEVVDNYIRKSNIKQNLRLELTRYKNELKPKTVEYKITAMKAVKLDPYSIFVRSSQETTDAQIYDLSDIIVDQGALVKTENGHLNIGKYFLEFLPIDKYSDFKIDKCDTIDAAGKRTSLLVPNESFALKDGSFRNVNVLMHANQLEQAKTFKNIREVQNGLAVGSDSNTGTVSFDVSGMGGNALQVAIDCQKTDFTRDAKYVKYDGFVLENENVLHALGNLTSAVITIDMECVSFAYELIKSDTIQKQGCISVLFEVDGKVDTTRSGLTSASGKVEVDFGKMSKLHVEIRKTGSNDVYIRGIEAAMYKAEFKTEKGQIISSALSTSLPLPSNGSSDTNTLTVTLEQYSTHSPVLQYVHVGPPLSTAYRTKQIVVTDKGITLDVKAPCKARLYSIDDNGAEKLVKDNYKTAPTYYNASGVSINVPIDISDYTSITKSSKQIQQLSYNGRILDCLTFAPGEKASTITITGKRSKTFEYKSLQDKLKLKSGETLYCSNNVEGFIVKNSAGATSLRKMPGNNAMAGEYTLTYENLPQEVQGCFVVDHAAGIDVYNESYSHLFEDAYIIPRDKEEFIAYNETTMVQPTKENVPMVNTFSPALSMNELMVYKIAPVSSRYNGSAKFEHVRDGKTELEDWSMSSSMTIRVSCDFENLNSGEYKTTVSSFSDTYKIANTVELQDQVVLNGVSFELAKFVVKPPSDMEVLYASQQNVEMIIAENDGFNKLEYANVYNIDKILLGSATVPEEKYDIIKEAGIIIWNTKEYFGKELEVKYHYRKPVALKYKSINSLYQLVSNSVEAYKALSKIPLKFERLKNGDVQSISFGNAVPDKIVATCSNENFRPVVENGAVKVILASKKPTIMIRPGYYYDRGVEHYMFASEKKDKVERDENISFFGVEGESGRLALNEDSNNLLKDTVLINGTNFKELCHVDFNRDSERIQVGSSFNAITACDTYQMWTDFNMDISLSPGYNKLGLKFTSTDKEASYAILNITKMISPNDCISFYADDTLKCYIAIEEKANGENMLKSVFVKKLELIENTAEGYRKYVFPKKLEEETRYYLLVEGSGIIDDIICRPFKTGDTLKLHHRTNIGYLGFDFQEHATTKTRKPFKFALEGSVLNGVAWNKDGYIETAENIDWGLTRIADLTPSFEDFSFQNVVYRNDAFYASKDGGKIISPTIELPYHNSIDKLFVKVNDVIDGSFKNFNVQIRSLSSRDDLSPVIAAYNRKTNLLEVPPVKLTGLVQIVVELDPGKVINSIELYARYVETSTPLPIIRTRHGELTSKVFDATYNADFCFHSLEGDINQLSDMKFFVRGCKYDAGRAIWSSWVECNLDKNMKATGSKHIFRGYQYFQFKVKVLSPEASIKIDTVNFEVV